MTQILVLTEDQKINQFIQSGLFEKYGSEVLMRNSIIDAIHMLDLLPSIEVVICKDKLAPKISEYLKKNKEHFSSDVKLVVLGEANVDYPRIFSIPNKANFQKVIGHLGFIIGHEEKPQSFEVEVLPAPVVVDVEAEDKQEDVGDKTTVFKSPLLEKKPPTVKKTGDPTGAPLYVAISMKYFLSITETQFDFGLYSRVKRGDDFEYNVKVAADTKITKSDIDRMLIRVGRELYVNHEDYKRANEVLSGFFLARFKKPQMSILERMQLNSDAYEILLDVFKNGTLDKFSVEIIKELLKSIDLLLKSPNSMEAFFVGIKNLKLSYGYNHSYMGCMLLFSIVDKFSWSQEQSRNKILYLALFHDLALHTDRLIRVHHYPNERAKLSEEDTAIVNAHADVAASILETIIKSSKEVPVIIREHHGMRSGKGFPESLSLGISSLTIAYIVIEDFVTLYLEKAEKEEVKKEEILKILNDLKNKYVKLTYADVAEALFGLFKDR